MDPPLPKKKRIPNCGNGSVFHLGNGKCRPFRMDPDEAKRHIQQQFNNLGTGWIPKKRIPKKGSQIGVTGRFFTWVMKNVDHSGWIRMKPNDTATAIWQIGGWMDPPQKKDPKLWQRVGWWRMSTIPDGWAKYSAGVLSESSKTLMESGLLHFL